MSRFSKIVIVINHPSTVFGFFIMEKSSKTLQGYNYSTRLNDFVYSDIDNHSVSIIKQAIYTEIFRTQIVRVPQHETLRKEIS